MWNAPREDDQIHALPTHEQIKVDAAHRGVFGKPSSNTRSQQIGRQPHAPDPAIGTRCGVYRIQYRAFPSRPVNGRRLTPVVCMGSWFAT